MNAMVIISFVVLVALLTLASYVERIYTEMGRFLSRDFQENIEAYEQRVLPHLGSMGTRVQLSMSVLAQLCTALISMLVIYVVIADGHWTRREVVQAVVLVLLVIILFNRLVPFLFFTRTHGEWLVRLAPLVRGLVYLMLPVTIILNFTLSVAALAERREPEELETQQDAVEALIEAGREEGILEESDRELIQSVVEFGDKTVREVMTPRPDVFAVPGETTIAEFTEMIHQTPYSRVPVYEDTLDNIGGVVFAHDVLQITDVDARTRTVQELMKPAFFVPESKRVQELLREMQRAKTQMAVVIDEYGGVAGVVTVEDMLEEIVGEISDEHEPMSDVVKESESSYILTGHADIDRLAELFDVRPENVEATTIGGLLSEISGHIPQSGEMLELEGLRFEVLDSTERRVERVRVRAGQAPEPEQELHA